MKISVHKSGLLYTTLTINGHKNFIYGESPEEVEAKYIDMKYKHNQGYNVNDNPTLRDYMVKWYKVFKEDQGAVETQNMYKNCINVHINPALGNLKVKEITGTQVQGLLNKIKSSKSLAHKVRITLNQIFKQAIADRLIAFNPVSSTKIVAPDKPKRFCLSDVQRDILINVMTDNRAFPLIMMILYTGVRMGEALALTWKDIDYENGIVKITKAMEFSHAKPVPKGPKTENGYRDIPMTSLLSNYLKDYENLARKNKKTIYVFPGHTGGPMGLTEVKRIWKKANSSLNEWFLNEDNKKNHKHKFKLTFRLLRHTFCTGLFDAGIDEMVAAEIMGHDVKIMREVYTHIQGTRKQASIIKLENLYKDKNQEDKKKEIK